MSTDEQNKILEKYARLSFSKLQKNIVQDLINGRNESVLYKKYKKEEIVSMLENPQRNEAKIRELSGFIYLISSHYRRLVDHYSSILLYNYTVVPTGMIPKKPNKNQFTESYYTVVNDCEKYNVKQEARKAIKVAVRDGIFCGLKYENDVSFYIKPFDTRYAKISSVEDGSFMFSVDLAYFSGKEYLLDMYGKEFTTAYYAYKGDSAKGKKGDKALKWFEPKNGICLKADESDVVYSLPLFTGLLMAVFDIEDYKMLKKAKSENDNYKALSLKMETDENGVPLMDFEVAQKYYGQISQNIGENIGLFLSPFNINDFSFQSSTASDRDTVSDAEDNFWFSSGTSSLIFGSSKATSSSSLSLSVKPDEAIALTIVQQFERNINKDIKNKKLPHNFKLSFSNQSIFNTDEIVNRLSKAATFGVPVKLQYASALGMSPSDVLGMTYLEEDILTLGTKKWIHPLVSSSVQSASSDNGRPTNKSNGESLTESGEQTLDDNENANK